MRLFYSNFFSKGERYISDWAKSLMPPPVWQEFPIEYVKLGS